MAQESKETDEALKNESDNEVDEATSREQLKLIYDYIKFHIGLYLSTPAVFGLLGNSFNVLSQNRFQWGLAVMMCLYLIAGVHAGWFMGRHINERWTKDFLVRFNHEAYSRQRRFFHHWLYWLGLLAGIAGLISAKLT